MDNATTNSTKTTASFVGLMLQAFLLFLALALTAYAVYADWFFLHYHATTTWQKIASVVLAWVSFDYIRQGIRTAKEAFDKLFDKAASN